MPSSPASSPDQRTILVDDQPKPPRHAAEPAPADFHKFGPVETIPRLAQRYGRSETLIRRWRAEHGFVGNSGFDIASTGFRRTGSAADAGEQLGDDTVPKRAANWLRKWGKNGNIFRTDIALTERTSETWADWYNWKRRDGPASALIPPKGEQHYMVDGHGVVPETRLIELAREKGFPE